MKRHGPRSGYLNPHTLYLGPEQILDSPHYFKKCKISAPALLKMVIHARSGVPWEIMGLMQGKVKGDTIVIVDSFALPVQGTETRVNAANEANEYMVEYIKNKDKVFTNERQWRKR